MLVKIGKEYVRPEKVINLSYEGKNDTAIWLENDRYILVPFSTETVARKLGYKEKETDTKNMELTPHLNGLLEDAFSLVNKLYIKSATTRNITSSDLMNAEDEIIEIINNISEEIRENYIKKVGE